MVSELLRTGKARALTTLGRLTSNDIITHSLNLVSQDVPKAEIRLRFTADETLKRIQADGQADSGAVNLLPERYSCDWPRGERDYRRGKKWDRPRYHHCYH